MTCAIYSVLGLVLAGEVIAMLAVVCLALRWVLTREWEMER